MLDAGNIQNSNDLGEMKWSPMVGISIVFHLVIFSMILFVPESVPSRPIEGVVYEVNLVELPSGGKRKIQGVSSGKETEGKAILKRDTQAKRIKGLNRKKEKKPLVIAKRTVKKQTLPRKRPEASPSRLIDRAISRIEKKVESESKDHINRAISKLERNMGPTEGPAQRRGEGYSISGIPIRMYQLEVENWIKSHWSFPVALHGAKEQSGLEAIVVVLVKRDGSISKTLIKERSSSTNFDQSVIKAIERSDPLPPFPEGYKKGYEEFEIKFNLKELEGY